MTDDVMKRTKPQCCGCCCCCCSGSGWDWDWPAVIDINKNLVVEKKKKIIKMTHSQTNVTKVKGSKNMDRELGANHKQK